MTLEITNFFKMLGADFSLRRSNLTTAQEQM